MTQADYQEQSLFTLGQMLSVGQSAPMVKLYKTDFSALTLTEFQGKTLVIYACPSLEISCCLETAKAFAAASLTKPDTTFVVITRDLPFALEKVQQRESLDDITLLSDFHHHDFGHQFGVTIANGTVTGLLASTMVVLDSAQQITHLQQSDDLVSGGDLVPEVMATLAD